MNCYFSGLSGVGIGPLAMLAQDAGFTLSGSDATSSPLSKQLEARGVTISYQQDGVFLATQHAQQPIDWFIYTSALRPDHPELLKAKALGIKTTKRADFLNHLLQDKKLRLIAIAGTHGKTTTTGMLVWVMKQLDQPVSYSVGTELSFGPAAAYQPGSDYFIYECDEFDGNFLDFQPQLALITSIDYDHPDSYPREANYLAAFGQFIKQSSRALGWQSQRPELFRPSDRLLDKVEQLRLAGQHNRANASLVLKAVTELLPAVTEPTVRRHLETFPGTGRRFEKLADNLYSDYAHHPLEISATLQLANELNKRVVVVYQPHQNIRQQELMQRGGYKDCFSGAAKIYWLPTYLSREDGQQILEPKQLIGSLTDPDLAQIAAMDSRLSSAILAHRQAGDLVVGFSAGDLDGWLRTV